MATYPPAFPAFLLFVCLSLVSPSFTAGQQPSSTSPVAAPPPRATVPQSSSQTGQATEQQDLRKAIDDAGNDRAALVKNLEAFLKKYPESTQRPQIYRALVESSLQLRDFPHAMDYAER
ncbi:MAG TPA: hypothetical protein VED66_04595, partial [Candidatus Sulfotelmatobacter sp.]|nr:hypothetical protein [Candidatus Sulfotelmatobacter sp.]